MDVVDGGQAVVEDFAGEVEVAKVGSGEILAGIASTSIVDGFVARGVWRVGNIKSKFVFGDSATFG